MEEKDRVRQIRKDNRLTLEAFGAKIGISAAAVSHIEHGKNEMSQQTRLSICREFNVSETWLRTGEGEMFTQQAEPDAALADALGKIITAGPDDFKRRLISVMMQMPESHWAVLADIAGRMADDPRYKVSPTPPTPEQEKGIQSEKAKFVNALQQSAAPKSSGTSSGS